MFPSISGDNWGLREGASVRPRKITAQDSLLVPAAWLGAAGYVASLQAEVPTGERLVEAPAAPSDTGSQHGSMQGMHHTGVGGVCAAGPYC